MTELPISASKSEGSLLRQIGQFLELTSDGIAFLDHDYAVTFLNRRAEEILAPGGYMIGRPIWEMFPAAASPASPSWENYRLTMESGVKKDFEAYYPAPLNVWLHVQCYPSEEGIILFFRDITEERRAHAELLLRREEAERQHSEIEAVYRTAPVGLALFDLDDFHYLRLNDRQAAFFGMKPSGVVGRTLTELAPIPGLRELFEQVASGTPVINHPLEGALITDPEDYRYWTVNYFPVYGADGKVQAITASSLEITQQKKAEMALIESEKLAAVGRLASSIAHEINNPLEAVTNLLYLAKTSASLDESKTHLEIAERELARVAAITSQTLRFHKQSTSPQAVQPCRLAETVLSVFRGRMLNARVEVETRYRDRTPVRCFEGEIRQVISNLVGNAADAVAATGGRMLVRSRDGRNWKTGQSGAVITLADTGEGMTPETLQKAFKAFYTTKGHTGTGLGLWICNEIVARHGGTLKVRSRKGPGQSGSAFVLFLPYDAVYRQSAPNA